MATLDKIREVLLTVRNDTDYNIGSPAALDHLLIHVVHLIDNVEAELKSQDERITRLGKQVANYLGDDR